MENTSTRIFITLIKIYKSMIFILKMKDLELDQKEYTMYKRLFLKENERMDTELNFYQKEKRKTPKLPRFYLCFYPCKWKPYLKTKYRAGRFTKVVIYIWILFIATFNHNFEYIYVSLCIIISFSIFILSNRIERCKFQQINHF